MMLMMIALCFSLVWNCKVGWELWEEDGGWVPWSKYKLHWVGCCWQRLPLIDIAKSHWIWTGAWCYTSTNRDDWWLHTELERFFFVTVCDASRFGSTSSDRAELNTSMQEIGIGRRNKAGVFFFLSWKSRSSDTISLVRIEHVFIWPQMKIRNEQFNSICCHNIMYKEYMFRYMHMKMYTWYIWYAQLWKYAGFALHFKLSYLGEGLWFYPVLFNPNVWPGWFVLRDAQLFQQGFVLRRWSD